MRKVNKTGTDRADAHMRWAERYNREGQTKKAIAHFGRALDYTAAQRFGGPLAAFTAAAGHPGLTSILPTVTGAGTGTGTGTIVSMAPPPAGPSAQASQQAHRSVDEYAKYVKKARELTAYSELGHQNQMRFLMRMRYYHVAAVIVGSTSDTEFDESAGLLDIRFSGTSPVTLLRNVMAQTEELSSYVAAKKKDDAIRMLDNDPMRGNEGFFNRLLLGAGEYTDSVSKTLRDAMSSTVAEVFPALRYEPGPLPVTGNGVFDGCRTIADRCNTLAILYDLYAGTTTDAGKVLLASLEYAKSKSNENRDLIEWAIKDIEEARKEGRVVDMLSVVIAATADRGEAYVIKGIQYLVVYYHVQLKHIADAHARSSDAEPAAVVQYMGDLVKAVTTNTIRRACNIARMMADTLVQFEAHSRMNVKPSRIFARMWVDLTYGLNDAFPGKSEKIQALYEAARVIVDATPFHHEAPTFRRKTANEIVESVKDALNKDKDKKEAERREAERREAERREAERREAERREAERREAERREADESARRQKEAERREADENARKRREAERREADRREADENARKRREAERREAERREAERREADESARRQKEAERKNGRLEPAIEIQVHSMVREALGLPFRYQRDRLGGLVIEKVKRADLLAAGYNTYGDFKSKYRKVSLDLHPDKRKGDNEPMIALNKINDEAKEIFKAIEAREEKERAAREQKEKTEKRNDAA
jgi:hypothetical protein